MLTFFITSCALCLNTRVHHLNRSDSHNPRTSRPRTSQLWQRTYLSLPCLTPSTLHISNCPCKAIHQSAAPSLKSQFTPSLPPGPVCHLFPVCSLFLKSRKVIQVCTIMFSYFKWQLVQSGVENLKKCTYTYHFIVQSFYLWFAQVYNTT